MSVHPLQNLEAATVVAEMVWEDLDEDPTRVGDLLAIAVKALVEIASSPYPTAEYAAETLGRIEQRTVFGPDAPAGLTAQEINP